MAHPSMPSQVRIANILHVLFPDLGLEAPARCFSNNSQQSRPNLLSVWDKALEVTRSRLSPKELRNSDAMTHRPTIAHLVEGVKRASDILRGKDIHIPALFKVFSRQSISIQLLPIFWCSITQRTRYWFVELLGLSYRCAIHLSIPQVPRYPISSTNSRHSYCPPTALTYNETGCRARFFSKTII